MDMNNRIIPAQKRRRFRFDRGKFNAERLRHGRKADFAVDAGLDFWSVGTVGDRLKKDFLQLEHELTQL